MGDYFKGRIWLGLPIGANSLSPQEQLLCKWYNVGEQDSSIGNPGPHDGDMYFAGSSDDGADLLELGSNDSDNAEPNAILFESASEHSETEILLGSDQEMLMESGEDVVGKSVEEPPGKKRKYATRNKTTLSFLGKEVCSRGHQRLYGIGSHALQKLRGGQRGYTMHENRAIEPKHPQLAVSLGRSMGNCKWPHVLSFFWMLYMSVAEILPHKLVMPSSKGQGLDESFLSKDPDYQDRYTENFMRNIERNYEINPVT